MLRIAKKNLETIGATFFKTLTEPAHDEKECTGWATTELLRDARVAANVRGAHVAIVGGCKGGRQALARQIYKWSPESTGTFVEVDCDVHKLTLSQALFGTGPFNRKSGPEEGSLFRRAEGGFLVLHSFDRMPLQSQNELCVALLARKSDAPRLIALGKQHPRDAFLAGRLTVDFSTRLVSILEL